MAIALSPHNQNRVNELELLAHRRLHLIDDLNAELSEILRELHVLTGDPSLARMADATDDLKLTFRDNP
jgi:hypothetical protein